MERINEYYESDLTFSYSNIFALFEYIRRFALYNQLKYGGENVIKRAQIRRRDERNHNHDHGKDSRLLARGPADMLQLRPCFLDVFADAHSR